MQRIRKQGLYNWRYFRGIGFAGLAAMVIGSGCQTKDSAEQIQPGNISISDQLPWSVRMADSEMYRRGDSLEYNKDNRRSNWNYQTGLFLKALLDVWSVNGNAKYFDYVKKVIDSFVREDGTIETYFVPGNQKRAVPEGGAVAAQTIKRTTAYEIRRFLA
jgi:hypothetical protein